MVVAWNSDGVTHGGIDDRPVRYAVRNVHMPDTHMLAAEKEAPCLVLTGASTRITNRVVVGWSSRIWRWLALEAQGLLTGFGPQFNPSDLGSPVRMLLIGCTGSLQVVASPEPLFGEMLRHEIQCGVRRGRCDWEEIIAVIEFD